ncbi:DUF1906 domain-containing protein [Nocardia stercoris]|uniref:DUF1906 domain-containing protein n=2 Tax=Nocardia stercoris TaxID=2483361 RepID=A0A3M2LGH8_9NOCA|nr:DUF1906 domain-containing protein [Nocardia stercoris]
MGAAATALGLTGTGTARADDGDLGTLLDYAGGVPSAAAIRAAGHAGAIRYVSDRRPGAEWMAGKPLLRREVDDLRSAGLAIVSCYQFGKGPTADWRGGLEAGKKHAARGLILHIAAGGPDNAPIYASIDDNPSADDFDSMIGPYMQGWQSVLGPERTGMYANSPTIDRAHDAGLAAFFWQHDWGTPAGYVHPAANLHQNAGDQCSVDDITADVNSILSQRFGAW